MDFNNFLFQLNQANILNAVSKDFSVCQVMFSNHFDQMSLYLSISFTERFFSPRQDPPCPPRLQSSEVSISLHPHHPLPHHQRRRRYTKTQEVHKDIGGTQRHRRDTKTQKGHKDTGTQCEIAQYCEIWSKFRICGRFFHIHGRPLKNPVHACVFCVFRAV